MPSSLGVMTCTPEWRSDVVPPCDFGTTLYNTTQQNAMVRPSAGETSQPLLRAFSAQSLVGQSSVLLVAPTGSIAPSDRSANPLRRVSRSCGNLRLVTDGRIGSGDRLMLPAILALVALVAAGEPARRGHGAPHDAPPIMGQSSVARRSARAA